MAADDPSATREPRPDSLLTATTQASSHRGDPGEPTEQYTGVVVIHGIGNQKRNSTLLEAVNALTYWFNHHAGLDLDSEGTGPAGTGRVWVTTELRDDDDPDAEASHATLRLVAPPDGACGQGGPPAGEGAQLRLEFREVWWAESFGIPKVGAALAWARVQFREQLRHLLLPAGFSLGPAQTARRAPAREIAQALTYQPEAAHSPTAGVSAPDGSAPAPAGAALRAAATRPPFWRGVGLWLYDLVQYLWKLAQWLVLTPLISVLLVLLGLVRLLARIPLLQWSLVASATALINSVVLHWVASMQVYLLDYGRSAAMRQRFEREVQDFLRDPQCTRLVVIAHSMGTVISYEGLTTLLKEPDWQARAAGKQQITYICLAQALRRVWLLSRTDPERLRGVLPATVRWLHFWARYDPVAVGPLYPDALPPPAPGAPPWVGATDKALRARLADCENVDVVNTDSIYSDHTTYWDNLEQVVGPIAHELVAGSPALERLVAGCLAPREEVLQRRWRVAWRALVSLAGGFGLAAVLVALDARNGGGLSQAIAGFIGGILNSAPVQSFLDLTTFHLSTLLGKAIAQCFSAGGACKGLVQLGNNPYLIVPHLLFTDQGRQTVTTAAVALGLLGLSILLMGKLVAEPSPFAFRGASAEAASPRSVFVLAALSLLVSMVGLLVYVKFVQGLRVSFNDLPHAPAAAVLYLWGIGLGELLWAAALVTGVIDAIRSRRWGWMVGLPAGTLVALAALQVSAVAIGDLPTGTLVALVALQLYAIAIVAIALVGCLVMGLEAARHRRWGWVATLALVALPLGLAVGDILHTDTLRTHASATFGPLAVVAPLVIYALWAGPVQLRVQVKPTGAVRGALVLSVLYLLLLVAGGFVPWIPLVLAATLLGAGAWGWVLMDAVRARRWGWAGATVLLPIILIDVAHRSGPSGLLGSLPTPFLPPADQWFVWSVPFIAATLSYALWVGPVLPPPAAQAAARRIFPALPAGLVRGAATGTIFALLLALLVWDLAPFLPQIGTRLVLPEYALGSPAPSSGVCPPVPGLSQYCKSSSHGGPAPSGACPPVPGLSQYCKSSSQQNSNNYSTNPYGITTGPDHNLWFTDYATGVIGRITPKSSLQEIQHSLLEFPLPISDSLPNDITAGPDGNLWFTEHNSGAIGRITPKSSLQEIRHSLQEFALPDRGSGPVGITVGPDRNLWFTEFWSGKIGRITPQGSLQEFPLPISDSQPNDLTVGPDGNLWFTEQRNGVIGRITPQGSLQDIQHSLQEFPLPDRGSGPADLTVGPDGNLWFTEQRNGVIGRITPQGSLQDIQHSLLEFALPDPNSQPNDITVGPDHNLWFTEYGAGKIGRITPTGSLQGIQGSLQEFALPPGEKPLNITVGSDGNLWFTDYGTGKIGYVSTGGAIQQFGLPSVQTSEQNSNIYSTNPYGITAGPDHNLWFTDYGTGAIGRITPTGSHQEFPLPISDSLPNDITAGPDGNLWFTEYNSGAIGRITPKGSLKDIQGSLQEFPLPDRRSGPVGITVGPDGDLWFTEFGSGAIGRITPQGSLQDIQSSLQEFPLPISDSQPNDLTVGPDGNLWFTEFGSGVIGRITPQGSLQHIQEFPLPNRGSGPADLTVGPDGNLWFTEQRTDAIGRITPQGSLQDIQHSLQEFPLPDPDSQPNDITVGPDHNLWFSEFGSGKIGRITPTGSLQDIRGSLLEYALPLGEKPPNITVGPDGNLWFTDYASSQIGYVTTGGAIQQFGLPSVQSGPGVPFGITAGPDHNLWFTDIYPGAIGRITLAGNIQEFPLPDPYNGPYGIVAGPDGNLWFTEYNSGAIGRITPTGSLKDIQGSLQEFPLPDRGSGPDGITVGPDGNLWFTEYNSGAIGRITPTGNLKDIQEFPLPDATSGPSGIAAGPDGNLWFTDIYPGAIGRITLAGNIQEFPLPDPDSQPYGMTAGPDGNLWFTEFYPGKIGRITPTGSLQHIQHSLLEFPLPNPHPDPIALDAQDSPLPLGITVGPDGNLWFTDFDSGTIGSMVTWLADRGVGVR
jgi:streptogramin lyase